MSIQGTLERKLQTAWIACLQDMPDLVALLAGKTSIRRRDDYSQAAVYPTVVVDVDSAGNPEWSKEYYYAITNVAAKTRAYTAEDPDGAILDQMIGAIRDFMHHATAAALLTAKVDGLHVYSLFDIETPPRGDVEPQDKIRYASLVCRQLVTCADLPEPEE